MVYVCFFLIQVVLFLVLDLINDFYYVLHILTMLGFSESDINFLFWKAVTLFRIVHRCWPTFLVYGCK